MLAVQQTSQRMNSLTLAEQREQGAGQDSAGGASWNSSLNQPSLGYDPHRYAAQDSGPDLAQEFVRYQRSSAPQVSAVVGELDRGPILSSSPLAVHNFTGFEMLAGASEQDRLTERIVAPAPRTLSFGSPFDELTMPPALAARVSGPTVKTQGKGVGESAAEINLANESFGFAA